MTVSPAKHSEGGGSLVDLVFQIAFWGAIIAIAVILGALAALAQITPGPQIANAYEAGKALYRQATEFSDRYRTDLWTRERNGNKGVTLHDPGRASQGLTLYTSAHENTVYLIDMDGKVVHRWHRPYSDIWDESSPVANPRPDELTYMRKAVVQPNGDLLVVYEGNGDTPYGYAIAKLDKDSNVLWKQHIRAHHDFDIGADGRIYVLTHELRKDRVTPFHHLASPYLDDYVVVLSPDGRIESKTSLMEAFANSPFRHLVFTVPGFALADPLHTNSLEVVTEAKAREFAFGKPGQILVSMRELGVIAVLDLDDTSLKWATRSSWVAQHDPDLLENGNILLFDNLGNYEFPEGRSRVIEYDPESNRIAWSYKGSADHPLDSDIRSSQQRLENGNTLITESSGGRLLEVTPDGDRVWEFVNPVRAGEDGRMIPILCSGERIVPERDLDPGFAENLN